MNQEDWRHTGRWSTCPQHCTPVLIPELRRSVQALVPPPDRRALQSSLVAIRCTGVDHYVHRRASTANPSRSHWHLPQPTLSDSESRPQCFGRQCLLRTQSHKHACRPAPRTHATVSGTESRLLCTTQSVITIAPFDVIKPSRLRLATVKSHPRQNVPQLSTRQCL